MFSFDDYREFLEAGSNRRDFIVSWLSERGVKAVVLPIDGHEHIYVVFPKESYSPFFKIKTVIAHYDIFPGSPGANDNSSSVYALMNWAVKLSKSGAQHNVRLIFTDGEELGAGGNGTSISDQGAFGLASVFRRLGIVDDDVFVFDCVGRGTVPVLCRNGIIGKGNPKFTKRFAALKEKVQNLLHCASGGNFVTLPVSYSDNAGFLACGIASVAVTMLPSQEASVYMYNLMNYPWLENFICKGIVPGGIDRKSAELLLPETWRRLHTAKDDLESIDENSFTVMERILDQLAGLKSTC